jgi:uncharacterized membrane protein
MRIALLGLMLLLSSTGALGQQDAATLLPGVRVSMVDLGAVEGQHTRVSAINNHGDVVGSGAGAAFVWTKAHGFRLIVRSEGSDVPAEATDINDGGVVVGSRYVCDDAGCTTRGFRWSASTGVRDLGLFVPLAINNAGDMAGECDSQQPEPCIRRGGVVARVPVPPNPHGERRGTAYGINERGDVTGTARAPFDSEFSIRAFIFDRQGRFRWLPPRHLLSQGQDVNERGEVAGRDLRGAAFWSRSGRHVTLPRVNRVAETAVAFALDNHGLIVGTEWRFEPEPDEDTLARSWATLWDRHRNTRMNLDSHAFRSEAVGINDHGQIVGRSSITRRNGIMHAVVWTVRYVLTVTTPNAPSRWGVGTQQRIGWTYSGDAPQFQIEISRNSGRTWDYLATVANASGDSQNFDWNVTGPLTSAAKFRVTAIGDPEASDVNDVDIRIAAATIEMLSPTAATSVAVGSPLTIFYRHSLGARAPVAIDVSRDNGNTWRTVAETRTTGSVTSSFRWVVDLLPTTRARVRIRALDGNGARDVSRAFVVKAPS